MQYRIYFTNNPKSLRVLLESDVVGELTESLPLHVDSILADEAHSSPATGDTALASTFAVGAVVAHVEFVLGVVSHFVCCVVFLLVGGEGSEGGGGG